jgi:ComF family protein
VHDFKFRDLSALAEDMAPPMAALVEWPVDVVVPVPLTAKRERQRGYNQSRLLAKEIAAKLGVPIADGLKRLRDSRQQAKSATRDERWFNVEGAFAARLPGAIEGRSVLLVDDVATTGATLDACARALLAAVAGAVTAVTFARED